MKTIELENNKGERIALPAKLTLAEMVKRGMTPRITEKDAPLPDGWWRATNNEAAK